MALVVTESRPLDWIEAGGVRQRRFFGMMARQVVQSEALTIRTPPAEDEDVGQLVAIVGIWADQEAWFLAGPACRANLLALIRIVRQVLREAGLVAPGLPLTAYIDPGSVAGDRLAAMLGFTEAGVSDTLIGPLRTWRRIL